MFIFSEDPPLKFKGHGLSVLLYNLFKDSDIGIEKWFTFISGRNIYPADIEAGNGIKVQVLDLGIGRRFLRRYGRVNSWYNQFLFFLFFPLLIVQLRRRPRAPLFIPIGASARTLYKIRLLTAFTINPLWLYIVDDFNKIALRKKEILDILCSRLFYRETIIRSQRVYAISEGLANEISTFSGRRVEVILPCFQKAELIKKTDQQPISPKTYTYVFTGGLSFLYNDTLKIFSEFLERMRGEDGVDFRIIVQTYSRREEFDRIGFSGSNVEYRTSEDRSDLYKTYQEADAFIVPYSFDPVNADMISTSFPQKIAQIIQLGVPILVFGPPYGSVVSFFADKKLKYFVDDNDYEKFKETIIALRSDQHKEALIEKYLHAYEQNFSQKACLEEITNFIL